jgi:hypothetical protein
VLLDPAPFFRPLLALLGWKRLIVQVDAGEVRHPAQGFLARAATDPDDQVEQATSGVIHEIVVHAP